MKAIRRAAVLIFVLCSCIVWAAEEALPRNTIQIAWFYKPPKDGNLDTVAKHFDVYILTKSDEEVRDQLKAKGVRAPFLQYIRFDAIEDPGSCNKRPHRNQVAYRAGDFCKISTEHPDWFLKDRRGRRIVTDGYYMMDPGNQGWREYFLKRALETQERYKWDGIFLDNVEASLVKRKQKGGLPGRYRTEGEYLSAIEGFLKFIYESNFQPKRKILWANIITLDNTDVWYRYLNYLDGAMMEAFAVDWHHGFRNPKEWQEHLERAEESQRRGKRVLLVAQGEKDNHARQEFAFASYLLVANGKASFRYSKANHYVYPWVYNNYGLKLGEPRGQRYFSRGWWRRDFANGSVAVNPQSHKAEIRLNR